MPSCQAYCRKSPASPPALGVIKWDTKAPDGCPVTGVNSCGVPREPSGALVHWLWHKSRLHLGLSESYNQHLSAIVLHTYQNYSFFEWSSGKTSKIVSAFIMASFWPTELVEERRENWWSSDVMMREEMKANRLTAVNLSWKSQDGLSDSLKLCWLATQHWFPSNRWIINRVSGFSGRTVLDRVVWLRCLSINTNNKSGN